MSKVLEHNLSCGFLKALVLTTEAREEINPLEKVFPIDHSRNMHSKRKQKNYYKSLRNEIEHLRAHIVNKTQPQQNQEATVPVKLQEKYRALLSFDFEAAVFLCHWNALPSIIEESSGFSDTKLCAVFLDSILSAEAPIGEMVRVVMVRLPSNFFPYIHILNHEGELTATDNNKHPPHVSLPNCQQIFLRNFPPALSPLPLPTLHPSKRNPSCRSRPRQSHIPSPGPG